jgi:hypothetical protein
MNSAERTTEGSNFEMMTTGSLRAAESLHLCQNNKTYLSHASYILNAFQSTNAMYNIGRF